ncbi:hypothetical protein KR032_000625, partial [Drosophila birchii]
TAGPKGCQERSAWSTVTRKRERKRKAFPTRSRPDAVIVSASGKTYSEILALVTRREDQQLAALGSCVKKVRRTANGNLLLEVAKTSSESAQSMRTCIAQVLGDAAEVRAMTEDSKVSILEIRELDALAKEPELVAAIADQFKIDRGKVKVRSIRPGYAASQTAMISLPCSQAKTVLKSGVLRLGWSSCPIRERSGPPRAAQDLLLQTVRDINAEVAVLSEPYRAASTHGWVSDLTGKAALWVCGGGSVQLSDVRSAKASSAENWAGRGSGAGSIIDLTYASSTLARQATWRIGDLYTASDHEAILVTLAGRALGRTVPLSSQLAFRQDTFR